VNVIIGCKVYEGQELEIIENNLFLDKTHIGKVEEPIFRATTIRGQVYMSNWKVIDGGENV
jgi:hypothetical protein